MSTEDWTTEAVERLARWMGWKIVRAGAFTFADHPNDGERVFLFSDDDLWPSVIAEWDPFADCNADYQVLQRARDAWNDLKRPMEWHWNTFTGEMPYAEHYTPGAWSRAVLAVLKREEER